MTTSINWGQIATNVSECANFANTINQDMQNLSNPNNTLDQDLADVQALQTALSNPGSAFSGICTGNNPAWTNFQSGFTAALNQTLGNFPISLPVVVNGAVQIISTNAAGQPLTLANYGEGTLLGYSINIPIGHGSPEISASFLNAAQASVLDEAMYNCVHKGKTITGTFGDSGLTYTVSIASNSQISITFSGGSQAFGTGLSISGGSPATQPLATFLSENL